VAYAAAHRPDQTGGLERRSTTASPQAAQDRVRLLTEFANWSEYVEDSPPVLLVRATPKLVEGFWTMVARGAARTQGVSLPPIKRLTSGFWRMRAFCGNAEVTPIHPFELEQRLSDEVAVHEGLYVFDPGALGPQCGTVKLVLYSEKEPAKGTPAWSIRSCCSRSGRTSHPGGTDSVSGLISRSGRLKSVRPPSGAIRAGDFVRAQATVSTTPPGAHSHRWFTGRSGDRACLLNSR
jgi:hypothetical protein